MNALLTELSKPQYAGLSDQAAADAINAKTVYSDFVTLDNKSTGF